jgi:hypothetical protein
VSFFCFNETHLSIKAGGSSILKEDVMNIYEKLNLVQAQLKAPKAQFNNFGGFKYRSLEDIVEGVKPLLSEHGLSLTLSDTVKLIGDRFYIEATATLVNVEQPDQRIITTAMARESLEKKGMDASQITGSTSSYARKYCLNGLFNIDDTRDADFPTQQEHNNNHAKQSQSQVNYTGNQSAAAANNFQPPPSSLNNHTAPVTTSIVQPQQIPNVEVSDNTRLSGKQYKYLLSLSSKKRVKS